MLQGRLGHVEVAVDVDREGPPPLFVAQLAEVVDRRLERHVVDEDVQAAEPSGGLGDDGSAVRRLGEVTGQRHGAPARVFDQRHGVGGVVILVEVGDRHVGALLGERHRNGPADPGVTAGDQRPLARQQLAPHVVAHLVTGTRVHLGGTTGIRDDTVRCRIGILRHGDSCVSR